MYIILVAFQTSRTTSFCNLHQQPLHSCMRVGMLVPVPTKNLNLLTRKQETTNKSNFLCFQVSDMRWGIREQAEDDHLTTDICINEIKECQRNSVGPNFVVCYDYYKLLACIGLCNEWACMLPVCCL